MAVVETKVDRCSAPIFMWGENCAIPRHTLHTKLHVLSGSLSGSESVLVEASTAVNSRHR